MQAHLIPPLRKAIGFLEGAGFRYAIVGGIALAQWGFARVTYDVDIRIFVPDTNYAQTRAAIRAAFPESAREHLKAHPFVVAVEIDHVIVDFLLAGPGYEEQIIERAVRKEMGGWSAWVCTAEDLLIQKVYSRRERDWPDIESLLIEQWNHLDQEYIRYWIEQFAEALQTPEILDRYQRLVSKVQQLPRKKSQ